MSERQERGYGVDEILEMREEESLGSKELFFWEQITSDQSKTVNPIPLLS